MKKLPLFALALVTSLVLAACEATNEPDSTTENDSVNQTTETSSETEENMEGDEAMNENDKALAYFEDCGPIENYEDEEFFEGFDKAWKTTVEEQIFPMHKGETGDDNIEDLKPLEYISEACLSVDNSLFIAAVDYNYNQAFLGFPYIAYYNLNNESIGLANTSDFEPLEQDFPFFSFGKDNGQTIEVHGGFAAGMGTEFLSQYNYRDHTVYPKKLCVIDADGNEIECESF